MREVTWVRRKEGSSLVWTSLSCFTPGLGLQSLLRASLRESSSCGSFIAESKVWWAVYWDMAGRRGKK